MNGRLKDRRVREHLIDQRVELDGNRTALQLRDGGFTEAVFIVYEGSEKEATVTTVRETEEQALERDARNEKQMRDFYSSFKRSLVQSEAGAAPEEQPHQEERKGRRGGEGVVYGTSIDSVSREDVVYGTSIDSVSAHSDALSEEDLRDIEELVESDASAEEMQRRADELLASIDIGALYAPPPLSAIMTQVGQKAKEQRKEAAHQRELPQRLCPFCLPVRGDDAIGVAGEGEMVLHRRGCPLSKVKGQEGGGDEVEVHWDQAEAEGGVAAAFEEDVEFPVEIMVEAQNRKMLLADLSSIVSLHAHIENTWSKTIADTAKLQFAVTVRDKDHLTELCAKLASVESVLTVHRLFGHNLDNQRAMPSE